MGAGNIVHANMLFHTLYYDIISPTSVKLHRHFIYFLVLQKIYSIFWDFKIQNSVRITKGLDNGVSDNRNSAVLRLKRNTYIHTLTALIGLVCLAHLIVNFE